MYPFYWIVNCNDKYTLARFLFHHWLSCDITFPLYNESNIVPVREVTPEEYKNWTDCYGELTLKGLEGIYESIKENKQ